VSDKRKSIEERDAVVAELREFLRLNYMTGAQAARWIGVRGAETKELQRGVEGMEWEMLMPGGATGKLLLAIMNLLFDREVL
jgi:hypothetical protein